MKAKPRLDLRAQERVGRPDNMKVLSKQTFLTITVQILFDVKDEGRIGDWGGVRMVNASLDPEALKVSDSG